MANRPDPRITRRQAETHRASIRVGRLLQLLADHAEGKIEMSPTQVKSAQVLLAKVLPDQTRVETEEVQTPPSVAEIRQKMIDMLVKDPSMMEEARMRLEDKSENKEAP